MSDESSVRSPPTEPPQHLAQNQTPSMIDSIAKSVQVISVVVGVAISALSYNIAQQRTASAQEAEAKSREMEYAKYLDQRKDELERRQTEAAKPFLELRQKRYMEVVQVAAVLANPEDHAREELAKAHKRFRAL